MTETQCRVCLQYIELKSLSLNDKIKDQAIWEALNKIAGVQIFVGDPFPQNVCWKCFEKLSNAIDFRLEVEKSDKILHSNEIECVIVKQENDPINIFEPTIVIKSSKESLYEAPKVENEPKTELQEEAIRENVPEKSKRKRKSRAKAFVEAELLRKSIIRCCMCNGLIFPDETTLLSHIQANHLPEIESNTLRTYTTRHKRQCTYCKQKFRLQKSLEAHFEDNHFTEPPRDRGCEYENGKYKYKSKRYRGEKVVCTECGIVLANKDQMKMHELRLHAKEHPFECPHPGCGKKFSAKKILRLHFVTHQDRKHICDVCGKGFLNERFLMTHSYVHKDVKRYQCAHCPRTFTYKIILKGHIESHFEEKVFRCDQCDKTYKWKNDLTSHIKGAHQGNYPYKCKFCDKGYFCSSSRKYHQDRCDKTRQNILLM